MKIARFVQWVGRGETSKRGTMSQWMLLGDWLVLARHFKGSEIKAVEFLLLGRQFVNFTRLRWADKAGGFALTLRLGSLIVHFRRPSVREFRAVDVVSDESITLGDISRRLGWSRRAAASAPRSLTHGRIQG